MMQAQLHLPLSYSHLSLSILKWVPMCQGFNNFSGFLHNFLLAKLANISVRVKLIWTDSFVKWSDKALLEMARVASFGRNLKESLENLLKWLHNAEVIYKKFRSNF